MLFYGYNKHMKLPIGARLRTIREHNNLTLCELASEIGTTAATLSSIENGKRLPRVDLLLKIAKYFKIQSDFLLGLTNSSDEHFLSMIQNARKTSNLDELKGSITEINESINLNQAVEKALCSVLVVNKNQVEKRGSILAAFVRFYSFSLIQRLSALPPKTRKRIVAVLTSFLDTEDDYPFNKRHIRKKATS